MRLLLAVPIVALTMLAAVPARAQVDREVVRYSTVPTGSPVVLNRVTGAGRVLDSFNDVAQPGAACVAFTNNDSRTAKSVRIQFAYYDGNGDLTDGTLLTRNGTFATGIRDLAADPLSHRIHRTNCVQLHQPRSGFSAILAYIERVDFSDGTSWTSPAPVHLAKHVAPGSANIAFAFTDPGAEPKAAAPPGPVAGAGELAPLLLGTVASCSAALGAPPTPTPLFDPAVLRSLSAERNVFVAAQPGAAAGNLFNVGAEALCSPSGNPAHDRVALEVVKQSHITIRQAQVFRIYFPEIPASGACTDGVRLLNRVLLNATPVDAMVSPAKAGEYVGLVHVTVGADGRPTATTLGKSAGPPEFDDALRRSAMTSRFWPAIVSGKPVTGTFDFAMRWVVDPAKTPANIDAREYTVSRVFGPALKPAAAGCLAAT